MEKNNVIIRSDTQSWIMQVWLGFGLAIIFAAIGILSLKGENYERLVMATGFLFSLTTAFTLAKTIRDNREERVDTSQWIMQAWISFGIATALTIWSFFRLNIDNFHQLFLACAWVFLMMSTFTLSKTIRDNYESQLSKEYANK